MTNPNHHVKLCSNCGLRHDQRNACPLEMADFSLERIHGVCRWVIVRRSDQSRSQRDWSTKHAAELAWVTKEAGPYTTAQH